MKRRHVLAGSVNALGVAACCLGDPQPGDGATATTGDGTATDGGLVDQPPYRIERPAAAFDLVRVRLTVSEDRRVHFDSTEGVVTL
jgi:hypothetical protein